MTEELVINWLKETFGGAKAFRPSTNLKWKHQWRWRIQGKAAIELYKQLKPMLKIKGSIEC